MAGLSPSAVLSLLIGAALAAGCSSGPNFRQPPLPSVTAYTPGTQPEVTVSASGSGGSAQRLRSGEDLPESWWTLFQSEPLNQLIRTALDNSPTLAQAEARLKQAQEDYNARSGATRYPQADLKASAARQKVNTAAFGIPSTLPNPGPFTLYNASVNVSYGLDFFGANRRELEALKAQIDYQRYQLEAARLSLAANVAAAAVKAASLQAQASAAIAIFDAQSRQLAISDQRFRAGGISQLDLENQRGLLAQTLATLPPLQKQLVQTTHQLAILLGKAPADANTDVLALDSLKLPGELPLSLPSALARHRPDIRAAEAMLHQASAEVGVATANLYPQFTVSGAFGSQRTQLGDITNGINIWNFGLNLMQPIFHGGELQAKKRSAVAAYEQADAAYRQTVLQGLQEVADALRALEDDARTLQARAAASDQAQAAYDITRKQYELGGVSQLALLDAQRQQLQAQSERVKAEADRYADTVALLHALGGGWWRREE